MRKLVQKNRMFEMKVQNLREDKGTLRGCARMDGDECFANGLLLPKDQIGAEFFFSTIQQRKQFVKYKVVALDRLHNLQQLDSNASRTLRFESQDISEGGRKLWNAMTRN